MQVALIRDKFSGDRELFCVCFVHVGGCGLEISSVCFSKHAVTASF